MNSDNTVCKWCDRITKKGETCEWCYIPLWKRPPRKVLDPNGKIVLELSIESLQEVKR